MADPADNFGGLPAILQYALGIGTMIGTTLAIIFGVRSKTPPAADATPPATAGAGVQWYLDGPIGKALALLEGIYRETQRAREDQQRQANENNTKLDEQIDQTRQTNVLLTQTNVLLTQIKDRLLAQYQVNGPRRRP